MAALSPIETVASLVSQQAYHRGRASAYRGVARRVRELEMDFPHLSDESVAERLTALVAECESWSLAAHQAGDGYTARLDAVLLAANREP